MQSPEPPNQDEIKTNLILGTGGSIFINSRVWSAKLLTKFIPHKILKCIPSLSRSPEKSCNNCKFWGRESMNWCNTRITVGRNLGYQLGLSLMFGGAKNILTCGKDWQKLKSPPFCVNNSMNNWLSEPSLAFSSRQSTTMFVK